MKFRRRAPKFHGNLLVVNILRISDLARLDELWRVFGAVAILGPRQCGKTTLARQHARSARGPVTVFDLENPADLARLDAPMTALEPLRGLVVIDEIQRRPELFPVLRVLLDREGRRRARFLVLGSASPDLLRQTSESLAGRIGFLELGGFDSGIAGAERIERLWVRGGFPRSYLAASERASWLWREEFIATFLERDIPGLGFSIPPRALGRFWSMLAHGHGGIFDATGVGRSLGIADTTARRHLELLAGTFMIRELKPWYTNTKKRLVKRPKIYFRDSGLLHSLLRLESREAILRHPRLGASWEGFALEQAIRRLGLRDSDVFFWAVHTGAEMDLVFHRGGRLHGIEAKYADAPRITPSIRSAIAELALAKVWILHPGPDSYPLDRNVEAVSIQELNRLDAPLRGSRKAAGF